MQIYTNPARGSISSQLATESQRNTFVKCRNTRLAYKAQRSALIVHASDSSSGGLTSNSSLLGPSINLGGPSLGPKLNTSSAKPSINLDDVPLESGVSLSLFTRYIGTHTHTFYNPFTIIRSVSIIAHCELSSKKENGEKPRTNTVPSSSKLLALQLRNVAGSTGRK